MRSFDGIVIRAGVKIGIARLVSERTWNLAQRRIDRSEVEHQLAALQIAIGQAERELESHLDAFSGSQGDKDILHSHLLILRDPELLPRLRETIGTELESAPRAVQKVFAQVTQHFRDLENEYFAQRAADYEDVAQRLLALLTGEKAHDYDDWQPDQIAVLGEATPSLISGFARHRVEAYCAERGSVNSHASILSRSLGITAVADLPGLREQVGDGDKLILDGFTGRVIVAPDPATLSNYIRIAAERCESERRERAQTEGPLFTAGGRRIKLRCNIDLSSELDRFAELGADGIGLYRTEFLYLGKARLPSEDEQYEVYREAALKAAPHSVTIRSFDLGGDKLSHLLPSSREENPYLGLRGIRFSLAHPDIFRTQLRAVLRAACHGKIKLMFPMVADLRDFIRGKALVDDCLRELQAGGVSCVESIRLGVMIEVPSAALCADELAWHCDFLSIGTNDLVQYTLAADRNEAALTPYYISHHPAVVRLLAETIAAGIKAGKPVSVCGEMASRPEYLPLLTGLGCSDFSVGPGSYNLCRGIIQRCDQVLDEMLQNQPLPPDLAGMEELIWRNLKPYHTM